MKRTLQSLVAASMVMDHTDGPIIIDTRRPTLDDIMQQSFAFAEAMYHESPAYKRSQRAKRKTWHCRKCGAEFHPIRHPELCEECRP